MKDLAKKVKLLVDDKTRYTDWDQRIDVKAVGTNYIRYGNGLQMCWGNISTTTSGTTVTFGAAFKDTNYILVNQGTGYSINAGHRSKTTTSVIIESSSTTSAGVNWIAIGKWK